MPRDNESNGGKRHTRIDRKRVLEIVSVAVSSALITTAGLMKLDKADDAKVAQDYRRYEDEECQRQLSKQRQEINAQDRRIAQLEAAVARREDERDNAIYQRDQARAELAKYQR